MLFRECATVRLLFEHGSVVYNEPPPPHSFIFTTCPRGCVFPFSLDLFAAALVLDDKTKAHYLYTLFSCTEFMTT